MLRTSKKIISLILCFLMLFSCISVGVFAADDPEEIYPVVYLQGYGAPLYTDKYNYNSETIYPTGVDVKAKVEEALAPCLLELALGAATDNYDSYCDALYNAIAPIYDDLRLNPDGTVKDNSGRQLTLNGKPHISTARFECGEVYVFYDWRLSPITLADYISDVVDYVISETGVDKVNIMGRCYGANVVHTYLQKNEDLSSKINKVVLYVPSTEGIGLIGAIFSGKLNLNANNINEFVDEIVKYLDLVEDSMIKDFLSIILAIFEQATILDFSVDTLQNLLDKIKSNLIPRLVRDTYGSFPSFWSMVPDEYFNNAVDFVYNTDELREEYNGTIELIKEYHDTVQVNARKLLTELEGELDIYVISKYNLPSVPVFGKSNPNSDAISEVKYSSFGATAADYGKTLSANYINSMAEEDKVFLSADEKIDASTCTLPEKTWFIKNCYHDHFPASIDKLISTMLTTTGMTVFTNSSYPQFLDAEVKAETLKPVTTKDKTSSFENSNDVNFELIFNFVKFVIKLLVELVVKMMAE